MPAMVLTRTVSTTVPMGRGLKAPALPPDRLIAAVSTTVPTGRGLKEYAGT